MHTSQLHRPDISHDFELKSAFDISTAFLVHSAIRKHFKPTAALLDVPRVYYLSYSGLPMAWERPVQAGLDIFIAHAYYTPKVKYDFVITRATKK